MWKWIVSFRDKMNECVNVMRYKSRFIIYFQLNENVIKYISTRSLGTVALSLSLLCCVSISLFHLSNGLSVVYATAQV